jgi:chromosome segregation ATPase
LEKMKSQESELKKQLESAEERKGALIDIEAQRALVVEAQKEVEVLREEKEAALAALSDAHAVHDKRAAILEAEIDSLNKDVDVHREQMELAQTMLEEKETLASELRTQLEEAMNDEAIQSLKFEKQLASMSRDVNKVTIELEERNNYIAILENKLETARKEFLECRTEIEATAIVEESSVDAGDDDGTVQSSSTVPLTAVKSKDFKDHLIKLAEKDSQIDCLEREIRTSKLRVEQLGFELDEKDKHADYLNTELEQKNAKIVEVEAQLDEKNKSLESLRKQLNDEKEAFIAMCEKLTKLQNDLSIAVDSAEAAEDAHQHATTEMQAAKAARLEAVQEMETLKNLVEQLENRSASAVAEVEILKSETEKERKSSMQAAATLAATNAARQVEMEMTIEKLQKEVRDLIFINLLACVRTLSRCVCFTFDLLSTQIDSQRHEIDAVSFRDKCAACSFGKMIYSPVCILCNNIESDPIRA